MKIKKALVIAPNGPEASFGGGQRTLMAIKLLQEKGFEVEMLLLIDIGWGIYGNESYIIQKWRKENAMVKYFQPSFRHPYIIDFGIHNWLRKNQHDYELLIFRDETTAFKAGFYFLPKEKIIIDLNDFHFPHVTGYRKIKYLPLNILLKNRIKKAWVLTEGQRAYVGKKAYCVQNLPLAAYSRNGLQNFKKSRTTFPSLLFVGSYIDHLLIFLDAAHKDLIQIPSLKIYLVSRAATEENKTNFNHPIYEWHNSADDVTAFYSKAWISIIPVYKREGPLIKLIESIYYDTPVVGTRMSLNGYESFNKEEELLLCSDDVQTFIDNIKKMISDPAELDIRAAKLKKIALENFSPANILAQDIF